MNKNKTIEEVIYNKVLCVDWELKLSDDFEILSKGDKEIILSKIANDILKGFNVGSIGIETEE